MPLVLAPVVGVLLGQLCVVDHEQILRVRLFRPFGEVEQAGQNGFAVDHHHLIVRDGVLAPSLPAAMLGDGRIKVVVNGESGGTVELQKSRDWVNWQRIAMQTNFTGVLEFTSTPASGAAI